MLAHLITTTGDALPAVQLPAVPRIGETLALPHISADLWRVRRVHWPIGEGGACEAVELHLARAAIEPEG